MLTGYDSSTAADLPAGGDFYLGYIDGKYTTGNYQAVCARFPGKPVLSVTTVGNISDIADCETGDLDPSQAASGYFAGLWKAIYCNLSTHQQNASLFSGIPWYAAHPTGVPHMVPGSIATQWAWPSYGSPGHYDISIAPNLNTFQPPSPPPPAPEETDMITRDPKSGGYWAVRPSGDVYAYGAPYLGPLPKYLSAWGIGTTVGPIVGITNDGQGGFVLCADNNQYPGQPALYHITADGQYSR